jgi:hypothetical protein
MPGTRAIAKATLENPSDTSKTIEDAEQSYTYGASCLREELTLEVLASSAEWAAQQWGAVDLGDKRLERRAVQVGAAMAEQPGQSLPQQMAGERAALDGAYFLLNHPGVTLQALSQPHWERTLQRAQEPQVVLFIQDTTQLDFSHLSTMEGLSQIGDGEGRGLLLHSTSAVVPGEAPQLLGLAHQQVVLRRPKDKPRPAGEPSAEGQVWARAAAAVGTPPAGTRWVHAGDRGSDNFSFMHTCRTNDADYLIRVRHNRLLAWDREDVEPQMRKLMDYARTLPAQHHYRLEVPANHERKARTAHMHLAWTEVTLPAPKRAAPEVRSQPPLRAWVLRAWEVAAPPEAEPLEWILITSVPTETVTDALERVAWYALRWFSEDFHQCVKTGCQIEHRQFDHADDIRRVLGFCSPIAVRLLQMRQASRQTPMQPALRYVGRLPVRILAARLRRDLDMDLSMGEFWEDVAHLGGYLGRKGDGPPGWKTLWRGWRQLTTLLQGARLFAAAVSAPDVPSKYHLDAISNVNLDHIFN